MSFKRYTMQPLARLASPLAVGCVIGALAFGMTSARAGVVYDTTLAAPGFYNGSGNPSTEFTVDTETAASGSIELGLRARFRGGPDVTPVGNVYTLPAGNFPGKPTYALWNYDFSVNLLDSGLHIPDVLTNTTLTVKDVGTGVTASINPFTHWGDDASYAAGPVIYQNGAGAAHVADLLGAQNSENLGFGDSPLFGDFDLSVGDTYIFTLTLVDAAENVLGSDQIVVDVIPEPASLGLFGMALAGFVGIHRRKRKAA